jgi:hypothetical protein
MWEMIRSRVEATFALLFKLASVCTFGEFSIVEFLSQFVCGDRNNGHHKPPAKD